MILVSICTHTQCATLSLSGADGNRRPDHAIHLPGGVSFDLPISSPADGSLCCIFFLRLLILALGNVFFPSRERAASVPPSRRFIRELPPSHGPGVSSNPRLYLVHPSCLHCSDSAREGLERLVPPSPHPSPHEALPWAQSTFLLRSRRQTRFSA